ncbi:MAG TPA: hypothetical protein VG868_05480 [Casimicrobiaceae bacterium]|nr:hypothetical protein [Casimicrobiaceae bacterium]
MAREIVAVQEVDMGSALRNAAPKRFACAREFEVEASQHAARAFEFVRCRARIARGIGDELAGPCEPGLRPSAQQAQDAWIN